MPTWDASQYLRYERERTQPCIDLLSRIEIDPVGYAVDLGCGPGNSTIHIARKYPRAVVTGVDNSQPMLDRARIDHPHLSFALANAASWQADRPCDLIFSNAAFQWLDRHDELLPRLIAQLRPGGALAVQMPRNFQSPTHQILRELARSPEWSALLEPREPYWVHPPGFYYDVLAPIVSRVDIWETEYQHVLADHDAIVDWYKGTGLRPYLQSLDPQQAERFIAQYHERLVQAYPRQKDAKVIFPFLRIFLIAIR
jgi:trans-aconitate 2-methyltransferase